MVTLISGTNRENNQTLKVVKHYASLLRNQGIECQILDLSDLPNDFAFTGIYGKVNQVFRDYVVKYFENVDRLVIISPEYNGSYPGILKTFIEGWNPKISPGKRVALVGVASGRQGNSRGMDHLTGVLNYLQMEVVPFKIPIAQINHHIDENGVIANEEINQNFLKQINSLMK